MNSGLRWSWRVNQESNQFSKWKKALRRLCNFVSLFDWVTVKSLLRRRKMTVSLMTQDWLSLKKLLSKQRNVIGWDLNKSSENVNIDYFFVFSCPASDFSKIFLRWLIVEFSSSRKSHSMSWSFKTSNWTWGGEWLIGKIEKILHTKNPRWIS